jgi:hypothetical protein
MAMKTMGQMRRSNNAPIPIAINTIPKNIDAPPNSLASIQIPYYPTDERVPAFRDPRPIESRGAYIWRGKV